MATAMPSPSIGSTIIPGMRYSNAPAAIEWLPAEQGDNLGDLGLGGLIIAAQKHRRDTLFEVWIHHARVADAVEGFDDMRRGKHRLNLLPQRFVRPGGVEKNPVHGRRIGQRVRRIN